MPNCRCSRETWITAILKDISIIRDTSIESGIDINPQKQRRFRTVSDSFGDRPRKKNLEHACSALRCGIEDLSNEVDDDTYTLDLKKRTKAVRRIVSIMSRMTLPVKSISENNSSKCCKTEEEIELEDAIKFLNERICDSNPESCSELRRCFRMIDLFLDQENEALERYVESKHYSIFDFSLTFDFLQKAIFSTENERDVLIALQLHTRLAIALKSLEEIIILLRFLKSIPTSCIELFVDSFLDSALSLMYFRAARKETAQAKINSWNVKAFKSIDVQFNSTLLVLLAQSLILRQVVILFVTFPGFLHSCPLSSRFQGYSCALFEHIFQMCAETMNSISLSDNEELERNGTLKHFLAQVLIISCIKIITELSSHLSFHGLSVFDTFAGDENMQNEQTEHCQETLRDLLSSNAFFPISPMASIQSDSLPDNFDCELQPLTSTPILEEMYLHCSFILHRDSFSRFLWLCRSLPGFRQDRDVKGQLSNFATPKMLTKSFCGLYQTPCQAYARYDSLKTLIDFAFERSKSFISSSQDDSRVAELFAALEILEHAHYVFLVFCASFTIKTKLEASTKPLDLFLTHLQFMLHHFRNLLEISTLIQENEEKKQSVVSKTLCSAFPPLFAFFMLILENLESCSFTFIQNVVDSSLSRMKDLWLLLQNSDLDRRNCTLNDVVALLSRQLFGAINKMGVLTFISTKISDIEKSYLSLLDDGFLAFGILDQEQLQQFGDSEGIKVEMDDLKLEISLLQEIGLGNRATQLLSALGADLTTQKMHGHLNRIMNEAAQAVFASLLCHFDVANPALRILQGMEVLSEQRFLLLRLWHHAQEIKFWISMQRDKGQNLDHITREIKEKMSILINCSPLLQSCPAFLYRRASSSFSSTRNLQNSDSSSDEDANLKRERFLTKAIFRIFQDDNLDVKSLRCILSIQSERAQLRARGLDCLLELFSKARYGDERAHVLFRFASALSINASLGGNYAFGIQCVTPFTAHSLQQKYFDFTASIISSDSLGYADAVKAMQLFNLNLRESDFEYLLASGISEFLIAILNSKKYSAMSQENQCMNWNILPIVRICAAYTLKLLFFSASQSYSIQGPRRTMFQLLSEYFLNEIQTCAHFKRCQEFQKNNTPSSVQCFCSRYTFDHGLSKSCNNAYWNPKLGVELMDCWSCLACSFLNEADSSICKVCGSLDKALLSVKDSHYGKENGNLQRSMRMLYGLEGCDVVLRGEHAAYPTFAHFRPISQQCPLKNTRDIYFLNQCSRHDIQISLQVQSGRDIDFSIGLSSANNFLSMQDLTCSSTKFCMIESSTGDLVSDSTRVCTGDCITSNDVITVKLQWGVICRISFFRNMKLYATSLIEEVSDLYLFVKCSTLPCTIRIIPDYSIDCARHENATMLNKFPKDLSWDVFLKEKDGLFGLSQDKFISSQQHSNSFLKFCLESLLFHCSSEFQCCLLSSAEWIGSLVDTLRLTFDDLKETSTAALCLKILSSLFSHSIDAESKTIAQDFISRSFRYLGVFSQVAQIRNEESFSRSVIASELLSFLRHVLKGKQSQLVFSALEHVLASRASVDSESLMGALTMMSGIQEPLRDDARVMVWTGARQEEATVQKVVYDCYYQNLERLELLVDSSDTVTVYQEPSSILSLHVYVVPLIHFPHLPEESIERLANSLERLLDQNEKSTKCADDFICLKAVANVLQSYSKLSSSDNLFNLLKNLALKPKCLFPLKSIPALEKRLQESIYDELRHPETLTINNIGGCDQKVEPSEEQSRPHSGGLVLAFGKGDNGRLGLGGSDQTPQPTLLTVDLLGDNHIQAVSCFSSHSICLTNNGRVYSWGKGDDGRLGHGDRNSVFEPRLIQAFSRVRIKAVSAGLNFSCALETSGKVWTFGSNANGQLGLGDLNVRLVPQIVQGLPSISNIAAGGSHILALSSGQIFSWGKNQYGQLGLGDSIKSNMPLGLPKKHFDSDIIMIAAGWEHSMAISSRRKLYTWGAGYEGTRPVCGHGSNEKVTIPTLVESLANESIAFCTAGWDHSMAITEDGRLFTWGSGNYGMLGHGTTLPQLSPKQIEGELSRYRIRHCSGGQDHSLAITESGHVFVFGSSGAHLGIPSPRPVLRPHLLHSALETRNVISATLGDKCTFLVTSADPVPSPEISSLIDSMFLDHQIKDYFQFLHVNTHSSKNNKEFSVPVDLHFAGESHLNSFFLVIDLLVLHAETSDILRLNESLKSIVSIERDGFLRIGSSLMSSEPCIPIGTRTRLILRTDIVCQECNILVNGKPFQMVAFSESFPLGSSQEFSLDGMLSLGNEVNVLSNSHVSIFGITVSTLPCTVADLKASSLLQSNKQFQPYCRLSDYVRTRLPLRWIRFCIEHVYPEALFGDNFVLFELLSLTEIQSWLHYNLHKLEKEDVASHECDVAKVLNLMGYPLTQCLKAVSLRKGASFDTAVLHLLDSQYGLQSGDRGIDNLYSLYLQKCGPSGKGVKFTERRINEFELFPRHNQKSKNIANAYLIQGTNLSIRSASNTSNVNHGSETNIFSAGKTSFCSYSSQEISSILTTLYARKSLNALLHRNLSFKSIMNDLPFVLRYVELALETGEEEVLNVIECRIADIISRGHENLHKLLDAMKRETCILMVRSLVKLTSPQQFHEALQPIHASLDFYLITWYLRIFAQVKESSPQQIFDLLNPQIMNLLFQLIQFSPQPHRTSLLAVLSDLLLAFQFLVDLRSHFHGHLSFLKRQVFEMHAKFQDEFNPLMRHSPKEIQSLEFSYFQSLFGLILSLEFVSDSIDEEPIWYSYSRIIFRLLQCIRDDEKMTLALEKRLCEMLFEIIDGGNCLIDQSGVAFCENLQTILECDLNELVTTLCTRNADVEQSIKLPRKVELQKPCQAFLEILGKILSRILPLVDLDKMKTPVSELIREFRHLIAWDEKERIWQSALSRTVYTRQGFKNIVVDRFRALEVKETNGEQCRETIFGQVFTQLKDKPPELFRMGKNDRLWKVVFKGEHADDYGGPYRISLNEICRELQSSCISLFVPSPNQKGNIGICRDTFVPNYLARDLISLQMYEFIGKLMGVAIRTKMSLDLRFPSIVWKYLVAQQVNTKDVVLYDSNAFSVVQYINQVPKEDPQQFMDILCLDFTVVSCAGDLIELIPNGCETPVSVENWNFFSKLVVKFKLSEFEKQCSHMKHGLSQVVPFPLLSILTWEQLEEMVCGSPGIDLEFLKKMTVYDGCSSSDRHILMFWEMLKDFNDMECKLFLQFVWGRTRLPQREQDFESKFKISTLKRHSINPDPYLPVSHTCFFSLEIPPYSSLRVMNDRFKYAILNCTSIDTDTTSAARTAAASLR